MLTKPQGVNSTVKTVKTAVKNQQQKKPVTVKPVLAKPVVARPSPILPRTVDADNEKHDPVRKQGSTPKITKPQTTGPSNQFEQTVPSECQHCSGTGVEGGASYGNSCEHCGGHGVDPRHPDHPDHPEHPEHEEKLEISDPEYYHHIHHVDEDGTAGAAMSVGGGSVEGLTDPNVGYAQSHKRQQIQQYKDMLRRMGSKRKNDGILRRKPPVL